MYEQLVSVVIPFFNTEKYIYQCLESVKNQTYSNLEIICVNDGSTDGSLNVVNEFVKRDDRFRVINIKKSNAGVARNVGLEKSNGTYIFFLDSDDFVNSSLIEVVCNKIMVEHTDFCIFGVDVYDDIVGKYQSAYHIDTKFFEKRPIYVKNNKDIIGKLSRGVPWDRIYDAQFLKTNGMSFQSIDRCNDVSFAESAILIAKKVSLVDEVLLHHRKGHSGHLQEKIYDTPLVYAQTGFNVFLEMERLDPKGDMLFGTLDYTLRRIDINYNMCVSKDNLSEFREYVGNIMRRDGDLYYAIVRETEECIKEKGNLEKKMRMKTLLDMIATWEISNDFFKGTILKQSVKLNEKIKILYENILSGIHFYDSKYFYGIYGAGKHSRGLLKAYQNVVGSIKANIVFIDSTNSGSAFGKEQIKYTDINSYPLNAVIISSFEYRKEMIDRVRTVDKLIPIVDFYNDKSCIDLFSFYDT